MLLERSTRSAEQEDTLHSEVSRIVGLEERIIG
jgi:hypothetical protein